MGCIIADEITHALKGTDAEMIILSENLYTRNGIPEIQADILEDKNPHLFAKYMEWRARSLKEQIGYANEIVRVRQNTAQIRELIATVKRMNAKNS